MASSGVGRQMGTRGATRSGARRGVSMIGLFALSAAGAAGMAAAPASAATRALSASTSPHPMRSIEAAAGVPAGARPLGAVRSSVEISGDVVLKPRDNAAVVRFIAAVTDQDSPMFHRYLPAGAFASGFGPTRSAISAATGLLKTDGLRVTGVSRDRLLIHFSGTASAIDRAFDTRLESYRLPGGFVGRAATSAVRLPSAIAGSVAAVLGLNDLVRLRPLGIKRPRASDRGKIRAATTAAFTHPAGSPTACEAATAAAHEFGGLTDDQIAHAYGAFGLYRSGDLGAGQHVAIYELEPFARSDVKTFDTCFFGAAAAARMLTRLHVHSVDGGQPAGPGIGEAILDVEDVSGIAPGATIDVYVGPSPGSDGTSYDPVDEYASMINADADQVISTSWGLCEQAIQTGQPGLQVAENLLFEQAAAQGQSIFASSGDNGSDDCNTFDTSAPAAGQNPLSVDDPGSQPYAMSVGGTTIDAATEPPREHVWNDGAAEGSDGGGISQSWVMPAWQRQATVPGIARPGSAAYANARKVEKSFNFPQNFCQATVAGASASTPCRLVPDVSAQADQFTGAITIFQAAFGGWGTIGGTSSSTPIWAATLALVNASSACTANPATRHGVGFASPLLYALASQPGRYRASFNDITAGNNDIYGLDNGQVFNATKGYDMASGLGTPRLTGPDGSAGLAVSLCGLGHQAARPVVTSLSPAIGSVAGRESVTIDGTGFETGGVPDVAAIQVGAAQIPSGQFTVDNATTITATLPPAIQARPPAAPAPQDGAGPADVIVTLKSDQSSFPSAASTFEYVDTSGGNPVPSVTGVVPYAGLETSPKPVTILGSGFTGATVVTFGGVSAASFTVHSPYRITATPPPFNVDTTTCAASGVFPNESATNDICQVQVVVTSGSGSSQTATILPSDEGPVRLNSMATLVPQKNCGCEIMQAPTEYDYVPAPTITSVSTKGAANLASEQGGTVITVHGTGLNPLTIDWADVGPASQEFSQDTSFVFMTGTELQIIAPPEPMTVGPLKVPFSVKTLAGQSSPVTITYAGQPRVTKVVTTGNGANLKGTYGAADTGGTPIRISGQGLAGQLIAPIEFIDNRTFSSFGTQYTFTVHNAASLTTRTVAQNPALVDVEVCTVTGCSGPVRADQLYLYPPGNSHVSSISPSSGRAGGGTRVTIGGDNLGCALAVFFGKVRARSLTQGVGGLDCGSTITVKATSPKGKSGTKVPVRVETIETFFAHAGDGTTAARFRYK